MAQDLASKSIQRFGTCSKDCYGSCVFIGLWNDDAKEQKFLQANPQISHPFTRGHFCSKLSDRKKLLYHPQRLKSSLFRIGQKGINEFKVINNETAIDIIAKKINEINDKFGPKSVVCSFSAGNYGLLSRYAPLRFFKKLGATVTTGGICNEGGCAGLTSLFGTYSITNPLQLLNPATELIVIWGSDVSNRNNHAYSLIKQAQNKGVKLVVLDSRLTQIAREADLFIPTIPGTDHLIALAICKYILDHDLQDKQFLYKYTNGYSNIAEQIINFSEQDTIEMLKISSTKIIDFINLLIQHQEHTIFNIGYSVQKDFFGGKIVQIIALIQILLGNLCKPATGVIYSQSDFNKNTLKPLMEYITSIFPSDQMSEIQLINLGKELQLEQYKMIFIYNFNPVSSLPNQNQVIKSFLRNDLFVVVQDLFLNETTKYADIVIPSKFDLESHDLITPYYFPGISINDAGPCPYPNCLSNFEFYKKLSVKMGWDMDLKFKEDDKLIKENCVDLLPIEFKKSILAKGYYSLFKSDDVPFNDMFFPTLDKKINLKEITINFGFKRLNSIRERKKNAFFLITPSHKYYLHSQLGQLNTQYLESFDKVFISNDDMESLNLEVGMKVLVLNQYGQGKYTLAKSPFLSKGIALIYSGSPYDFKDKINVNIFTPDIPEKLGFSGVYNSAIIEIKNIKDK